MTEQTTKKSNRRFSALYILAALILVMIISSYRTAISTIDCDADLIKTNPDVIMLGAWWCPYCAEARKYFHANNVHYCEYDIERTAEGERLYEESNGSGIPILIIDDKKYTGFDAAAFEILMNNRKLHRKQP